MNLFCLLTPKSEIKTLDEDCTIRQALEKMDIYKYSVVPLINKKGEYVGTLSQGDLIGFIKNDCGFSMEQAEKKSIQLIKRYRSYQALNQMSKVEQLMSLVMEQNFIPIVDDRNIFMGIVTRKKVMQLCKSEMQEIIDKN